MPPVTAAFGIVWPVQLSHRFRCKLRMQLLHAVYALYSGGGAKVPGWSVRRRCFARTSIEASPYRPRASRHSCSAGGECYTQINERRGDRNKERARKLFHDDLRISGQLGPQELAVAVSIRYGVLRHRIHVGCILALRHRAIRVRSRPLLAQTVGCFNGARHD